MGKRLDIITQQRLEKVQKLRERGINPYPNAYHRTHTAQEAKTLFEGGGIDPASVVSVAGRITALRHMGKATFLDLRDGSDKIQAYFNKSQLGPERYELLQDFDLGDFVGVNGVLFKTHTGEITVNGSGCGEALSPAIPGPHLQPGSQGHLPGAQPHHIGNTPLPRRTGLH
jgi:lysyl-tRNA synthetase class 2